MKKLFTGIVLCCSCALFWGQEPVLPANNSIKLQATFDVTKHQIHINQHITYKNESQDTLNTIYLNDWSNSYSTKTTPLAKRFAEEFKSDFHFAKNEDRGYTVVTNIIQDSLPLHYSRLKDQPDILKVELDNVLFPNESYSIELNYIVQIPNDKFTRYGRSSFANYNLRYWYITPAIYDGNWQFQSNKDLDDMFIPLSDLELELTYPKDYVAYNELDIESLTNSDSGTTSKFTGKNRRNTKLVLTRAPDFNQVKTDFYTLLTNLDPEGLSYPEQAIITDRIAEFIHQNLGEYGHEKLLITDAEYKRDPIYGLNLLPNFIRPFPGNFQYELKLLKTSLHNYLENTVIVNPRTEQWLIDGLQVYYMMKYVEIYYPDTKLLGGLAKIWGVRSFHAADLSFNEQYNLGYMHMARTNRDQPLTMQKDSLLKFNKNIANKYKAGIGFKYLDDFVNDNTFENTVKAFIAEHNQKRTTAKSFETYLKAETDRDIDWFFDEYLSTNKIIDYKIKQVRKTEDSVTLTIKNKRDNNMPISLFTLNNDSIVSKVWIEHIEDEKTITIPRNGANKLALNYDNTIPEYNLRDNWKSLKGFFFNNKPLQFRLFKDVEDPYYNQVFLMPLAQFNNIYDGLTLGANVYNKTLLRKHFNYSIAPQYATKSRVVTGSAKAYFIQNVENSNLYQIWYGLGGSYQSYAEDLFVRRINPYVSFNFRDKDDYRSNERQTLSVKYLSINRDESPTFIADVDEPNYSVFNIRYNFSDDNLIKLKKWFVDFQAAKTFGKVSFNYEYRHLFESNRQVSFRFFAGKFLYNKNPVGFDYFSFALDRPTDYLFEYNYLGRSEATGIFSQQLILAEGGFKSKLDPAYANQWITTANVGTSIWRYFQVYADLGLVKNKHQDAKVVYDSGFRLNLVQDYFEVYFPVYSNLGWEIGQPHYDQKIRFIFTVDPEALLGIFRRKWY